MAAGTEARRVEVLRAIVTDYIASQEPVGSKALVERHQLGVSSATIRNDMAVLESEGFIAQQHASSGRVPTEKGYRRFVDGLGEVKPMSEAEKRAIRTFLEDGVDLEDVLRRSVRLLAQLTRQAAVVQMPTLNVSHVKHVEVVDLTPLRLLLVLITDTGRVDQRNVELAAPISEAEVHELRQLLNRALARVPVGRAAGAVADLLEHSPSELRQHMIRVATVLIETLVEQPNDRLLMAGASNLTRGVRDFPQGLPQIIDALEEQVVMFKLLANVPELGNVDVLIGQENEDEELQHASIVTAGYGNESATLGGLGVVGPTFMDYSGTISSVRAVARYVSQILAGTN
ncbi:heat-inducible transcriptional repressor HrcA [Corynebacterium sp. MNWGS58]|uniref:heat-inducible transcriptional repressor HrcA n=1 Tax=Corynebacterium sp. 102791.4 TaxID=3104612 RepID=UPI00351518E1